MPNQPAKMSPRGRVLRDHRKQAAISLATLMSQTQPNLFSSVTIEPSRRGTDWVIVAAWKHAGFKPRRYSLAEAGSMVLGITPTSYVMQDVK